MLSQAYNSILRLHSKPALLKRLGSAAGTDIYSPVRITPSNFFRFHSGPEYVTVKGKEFVISVANILGQYAQTMVFDQIPTSGTYKIQFGASLSGVLNFDDSNSVVQTALRLVAGLEKVLVTGSYTAGFLFVFQNESTERVLGEISASTLSPTVSTTFTKTHDAWVLPLKKGDRVLDGSSVYSIDEVIDMVDLGGAIMGFRCRCD